MVEEKQRELWFRAHEEYWLGLVNVQELDKLTEESGWDGGNAEERLRVYKERTEMFMRPVEEIGAFNARKRFVYTEEQMRKVPAPIQIDNDLFPFVRRDHWSSADGQELPVQGCSAQAKEKNIYHGVFMEESGMVDYGDAMVSRSVQRFIYKYADGKLAGVTKPMVVIMPSMSEEELLETVYCTRTLSGTGLRIFVDIKLAKPSKQFYNKTGLDEVSEVFYAVGLPSSPDYSFKRVKNKTDISGVSTYIK